MPDIENRPYVGQTRCPTDNPVVTERPMPEPDVERREASSEEEERRSMEYVAGGSMLEAIGGAAVIVLAIIGLSTLGSMAFYMLTIATIVAGAGLVLHGSAVAARIAALMEEAARGRSEEVELGAGVTVEVLAGVAGIVLGILGLIGLVPNILSASALIAFGAALLLSSAAVSEMNDLVLNRARVTPSMRRVTRRITLGGAGLQALTGVAGVVLGILALTGVVPGILTLVGLLCIGSGLLLSGAAVSGRMFTFLGRSS